MRNLLTSGVLSYPAFGVRGVNRGSERAPGGVGGQRLRRVALVQLAWKAKVSRSRAAISAPSETHPSSTVGMARPCWFTRKRPPCGASAPAMRAMSCRGYRQCFSTQTAMARTNATPYATNKSIISGEQAKNRSDAT